MLWILPQLIVITVAEMFFSITGLEFTFMQVRNFAENINIFKQFNFFLRYTYNYGDCAQVIKINNDDKDERRDWELNPVL